MPKQEQEKSKPGWCSLNIHKISECMFEGICLSGGVCSFKKEAPTKKQVASTWKRKRNPEQKFAPNKQKKKKKI